MNRILKIPMAVRKDLETMVPNYIDVPLARESTVFSGSSVLDAEDIKSIFRVHEKVCQLEDAVTNNITRGGPRSSKSRDDERQRGRTKGEHQYQTSAKCGREASVLFATSK